MEEEDELEVLGNILECWANRGDGDELGDIKNNGKDDNWNNVAYSQHFICLLVGLFLEKDCNIHTYRVDLQDIRNMSFPTNREQKRDKQRKKENEK